MLQIGDKVTARINAQKFSIGGETFYTNASEKEVHVVACIGGDRLKVADESGMLFPDEFHLDDGGIWRTSHGWYLKEAIPSVEVDKCSQLVG